MYNLFISCNIDNLSLKVEDYEIFHVIDSFITKNKECKLFSINDYLVDIENNKILNTIKIKLDNYEELLDFCTHLVKWDKRFSIDFSEIII